VTTKVGREVQRLRVERGLSKRGLALESGMSATYVTRLERGDFGAPHPHSLVALARALDVDPRVLLAAAGYI
jgi:transcriptional regulator with XRE-family HTH domain